MQVDTALLSVLPDLRDGFVLVGLVNDLGNELGSLFDQTRIGRRELRAMDCVGRGIFHQQRQERKDTSDQKCEDDKVDNQKD